MSFSVGEVTNALDATIAELNRTAHALKRLHSDSPRAKRARTIAGLEFAVGSHYEFIQSQIIPGCTLKPDFAKPHYLSPNKAQFSRVGQDDTLAVVYAAFARRHSLRSSATPTGQDPTDK
eukprot:TRINITY_DN22694_c0_g1_i1.p1 TRINITY_DN22694_c0_g1~~TRINITY_DN22694_c0_g1_i1.p1  ORF type:complete len:132 (-),score=13.61 TRINITY_DN22694_c0_g1_i1:2-361(-)